MIVLAAACDQRPAAGPVQTDRFLVGAYYYTWYPGNFGHGYLRHTLVPPQLPVLGKYRSDDPASVERHIAWGSRYGIDFFALGWWPNREDQNRVIQESFLSARNIGDMRFCIFYETWALGYDKGRAATVFDAQKAARFVADMVSFARDYFRHPSYLTVGGRPVVILYLTRTLSGEYESAIARARKELEARGFDPFFIGDEVFWDVVPAGAAASGLKSTPAPQVSRIRLFDAITAYNLYENARTGQKGYPATSDFVPDAVGLYERYRAAGGGAVYVVPGIFPGYNDRGVRRREDHYAIPRQWQLGASEGSTLAELFDRLAFRLVDPRLNMMLVTTWNEWNEDTAIEPLEPAPPTALDGGDSGSGYTQGYRYSGHGTVPLEVVRDKVVAVAGRLTDSGGAPVWGAEVVATRDGKEVARGASDRDGYYRLSRLRMPPGRYLVTTAGAAAYPEVEVSAGVATTAVDLVVAPP